MKQMHTAVPLSANPYTQKYFSENFVFFDIETTGFSPQKAFIYLIGMAYRKGDKIHIYQFLAENRLEEVDILAAFFHMLPPFHTLITFNGAGFDIPFINLRAHLYPELNSLNSYAQIDLYRLISTYAHLFQLPDKKQKSVERFLRIQREDTLTGKDLISIYYAYEKAQEKELESLLLLHNYEDVLGMTELLALFSYRDLFEQPVQVSDFKLETCLPYGSLQEEQELLLTLTAPAAFPVPIFYQGSLCSLYCKDTSAKLLVSVFRGELKFYYENYKDYYYLPEEDTAIHKSIASFVDASHRKKATAKTCYTKKSGTFLPQEDAVFTPCFYKDKNDRISFFSMTDDFLENKADLSMYARHLLKSCE